MYVEDLEFCLRVQKSGWTIRYVPEAVVSHKGQGSQRNKNQFLPIDHPHNPHLPFFMYHLTKNRLLTMFTHSEGLNGLKFWAIFPIYVAAKSIQYLLNKRTDAVAAIVRGTIDSIKER
ncbi:MAG: hypothetical protein BBJ57_13320 [Desulfobacterales bacterium PC51MH44]|nr:MAG: hypothetical protein BBJ57_13320 [Desulfobacterales bacterium PC51MH44]